MQKLCKDHFLVLDIYLTLQERVLFNIAKCIKKASWSEYEQLAIYFLRQRKYQFINDGLKIMTPDITLCMNFWRKPDIVIIKFLWNGTWHLVDEEVDSKFVNLLFGFLPF